VRFSIVKSIKDYSVELYKHFLNATGKYVKENLQFNPTFGNSGRYLSKSSRGRDRIVVGFIQYTDSDYAFGTFKLFL
jgi:hypothetical protein